MSTRFFKIDADIAEIREYAAQGKIHEFKQYQLTDAIFYSISDYCCNNGESEEGHTHEKRSPNEVVRFSCAYKINEEDNTDDFTRFFKSVYEFPKEGEIGFTKILTKRIESAEYYHSLSLGAPDQVVGRERFTFRYRGRSFILDRIESQVYMTVSDISSNLQNEDAENIQDTRRRKIFHKLDAISNSEEIAGAIEDVLLARDKAQYETEI